MDASVASTLYFEHLEILGHTKLFVPRNGKVATFSVRMVTLPPGDIADIAANDPTQVSYLGPEI